jgi:riboflavin kinase/FMN adenylyltransferase
MRIIYRDKEASSEIDKKAAVALGNFDGFHIGHMMLIEKIKQYASLDPENRASCVWTFSEHSANILSSDFSVPYITSKDEKAELAKMQNIDYLIFQDFNYVRYLSPEEFIEKVIVEYLGAGLAVCGYDYRFGQNGEGSAEFLKESLEKKNIETVIIPPVVCEGQAVSSSFIRTLVKIGDMPRVKRFLGRPFSIKFPVVYGNQTGRKIGVPTINQLFPEGHIIPACGIYACTCEIGEKTYKAVTNIGLRPTVGGDFLNSETHIIDFEGDLYGESIKVNFHQKFRDEIKFANLGKLKEQIQKDIEFAKKYKI